MTPAQSSTDLQVQTPQTYLASLQRAMHSAFAEDPSVYLLGADLIEPYGGKRSVAEGLSAAFPDRVLSAPFSEAAIVGVAAGMAMRGLKPVAEIMPGNSLTLCSDQIVNHIADIRDKYDSAKSVPIVIRTPVGEQGFGASPAQSVEKLFLGVPELRITVPSHAHDPGALLGRAILKEECPTLFVEHLCLYGETLIEGDTEIRLDFDEELVGYPTALLRNYDNAEPDVTVITYGGMSGTIADVMRTVRGAGIKVVCALPSSIKPLPIETLVDVAAMTGNVVIVEEGAAGFNWGSEVATILYDRLHGRLARPIRRVATCISGNAGSTYGDSDVTSGHEIIRSAINDRPGERI